MKQTYTVTPLEPEVTIDEILAYEHGKPETYTRSRIVNAVCEKMFGKDVRMPEQVARSLGIERLKLTHAMEVLTGYSLADIRLEMLVKRWYEYRVAHPHCKEKELAAVIGYKNYNAYWRFMDRHQKRFPELQIENTDLRGHVADVMMPLMKDESLTMRRLYSILPYRGGKAEAEACARRLYTYGCNVANMAQNILRRHADKLPYSPETVRELALLHKVGIVWTDSPELNCHGKEPYDHYPITGATWLNKHKMTKCAQSSLMHQPTSKPELPNNLYRLIYYTAQFYSIANLDHRLTVEEVRKALSPYGEAAVQHFDQLHEMFK